MESILYHCLSTFPQKSSLFATFFFAGLMGSTTHCVGMCGSIAASGTFSCTKNCKAGKDNNSLSRYITGWKYHLGRLISYGGLGFIAAFLSKQIAASSFWPLLSALMLAIAGLIFLAACIPSCRHRFTFLSSKHHFIQGMLLGFMPCGLIYAALMMTATLANPFEAMVAMWMFVLGTIPALLITSSGIKYIAWKWQAATNVIGRTLMVFNGLSLLVIAVKNVI